MLGSEQRGLRSFLTDTLLARIVKRLVTRADNTEVSASTSR